MRAANTTPEGSSRRPVLGGRRPEVTLRVTRLGYWSGASLRYSRGVSPLLGAPGTRLQPPNRWGCKAEAAREETNHPSPKAGVGCNSVGEGHRPGSQASEGWRLGRGGRGRGWTDTPTHTQPTHTQPTHSTQHTRIYRHSSEYTCSETRSHVQLHRHTHTHTKRRQTPKHTQRQRGHPADRST